MFYVFARLGYEEDMFEAFDTKEKLADFIKKHTEENERCGTGFRVVSVIEGRELDVTVKQSTVTVTIGD